MRPSAEDYAWFGDDGYGLTVESCITLVRGLTSDEVIHRLGGTEVGRMTGLDDLDEHRSNVDDHEDDDSIATEAGTGDAFVAVTDVAGGTLLLEQYGNLGVRHEVNKPLSRGTDVVSVCVTEVNENLLVWAHDGDVRLECDMFHAAWREGSAPDALVDVMESLGFNVSQADADDPDRVFDAEAPARAFALAEQVTGVRFGRETLDASTYRCVSVPAPG